MLEVYLFHAMFALQILLGSVLIPRRLIQRGLAAIALRPEPLPPGGKEWVQRTVIGYRLANGVVVVIGLLLMGSLFSYMRQASWNDGPVEVFMAPYFLLQCLPFAVLAFRVTKAGKELKSSLPAERKKAVLLRRGLFDFVSLTAVVLALLCYPLYVALVLYIQRDPFPGFAGHYLNIGIVTLHYAVTAFAVYFVIYMKKRNPLQTHAARMREMETVVQVLVYSCLASVVALMTNFSLVLLDRQRLEPFALTTYFVVIALWVYRGMHAPAPQTTQRAGHTSATG
jgi:hypothetical protein